jgi:hypothetical protein
MAVTKVKPIKKSLNKALEYIENPAKTDGKMLVSSFGCSYETADIEMGFTLAQARGRVGGNLAHHLIQSFEPVETTPEQAHEIGKRLAEAVLKGQYEYVLTTHTDKGHVHNHLIFCAVNFLDHRKYVSNKKSYYNIRNISDSLCREFGLSVVEPSQSKGKTYVEFTADRQGGSWKSKLKIAINTAIPQSKTFENLLKILESQGFEVKRGKHISFRAPGQERFTRCKTLGVDYTEEALNKRISGDYVRQSALKCGKKLSLLIDIENSVKAQQSAGFSRWQKIENLKMAAKTLNFLTENNLLEYGDLSAKTAELTAAFDVAATAIKDAERRLSGLAVLKKHVATFRQTKSAYDGFKAAKNKAAYRKLHESKLILHEAAVRALQSAGAAKLPDLSALESDFSRLTAEKERLSAEYKTLKKQSREIGIIKANVDSILKPSQSAREQSRKTELS